MFRLPSEPLGIGRVLDNGIKLYLAAFKRLIPLMFVLAIVTSASSVILMSLSIDAIVNAVDPLQVVKDQALPYLVTTVLNMIIFAAMVYMIWQIANGEECSNRLALKIGVKKLLYMAIAFVLFTSAIGLGMFLLVIPGFIFMVSLLFTSYLIIVENAGPFGAVRRSHQLVWGNWWRTMVILSVVAAIMIGLYLITMFIGGLFGVMGPESDIAKWSVGIASGISSAVLSPLYHGIFIVCYHDLVLRHEGVDLSDQIDSLST